MLKFALRLAAKILSVALFIATCCAAYGGYVNPRLWATPSLLTPRPAISCNGDICRLHRMGLVAENPDDRPRGSNPRCMRRPGLHRLSLGSEKTAQSGRTFTVMSFNIMHGIDYRNPGNKGHESIRYISAASPDIVCIRRKPPTSCGLPAEDGFRLTESHVSLPHFRQKTTWP